MLPKNILIASGVAVVIVTGAFVALNNKPAISTPEGKLLQSYEQLVKKIDSENTKKALSASCDNQQEFAKNISNLEAELVSLMAQRVALSQQAEVDDGSKPLELSDGDYSQPNPAPGSQPLELSDGDYSKPGSKPLELSDGKYDIGSSAMGEMYGLEERIKLTINSLKSLCEKKNEKPEKQKEITSDSCDGACKKYSDCAGFTEDATKADQQDAYDSCMEECQTWQKETVICINKKNITSPADCGHLSQCALKEY